MTNKYNAYMKKLKAIQIIDSLNVGGAEVLAVNIANGLLEQNIESHICVTRKEGALNKNLNRDVGYLFLKRTSTFDVKAVLKLKKYIQKNDIAVIHAHSSSSFMAFCLKMISPRIKIIWHDHFGNSEFLDKRRKYPLKFFSYFFHSIISVNSKLKDWAIKNLLSKKKYFINNFATFTNLGSATRLNGNENKKIVHLAGFRPQKDHLTLLKAFKIIIKEHPDWTLHLIGKEYEDAYSKRIKGFIKEYELEKKIFLYGVCSDIKYILSQATIGVLSSKSEGLPISLLEYGLAKLPVLVTDVGECANVIKHKSAIVTPNRSDIFAKQLEQLISNKNLRKEISEQLHIEVINNFSKKKIIKKLINIYKN